MPTPKKLPNGRWRVKVYHYQDSEGKQHYKTITADKKSECTAMMNSFIMHRDRIKCSDLTVSEAIEEFIVSNAKTLSPATIRGYKVHQRNHYKYINHLLLRNLDDEIAQRWINELSEKLAPKTIANAYGLLSTVIKQYAKGIDLNVRLPRRRKPISYVPTKQEIRTLTLYAKEKDIYLYRAIILGACCPLRRSEICALESSDIDPVRNIVFVTKAMVKDDKGNWIVKEPKTETSTRVVKLDGRLIQAVYSNNKPVDITPDVLTKRFEQAIKHCGIHPFRFHDTRHFSVSYMLGVVGVPSKYCQNRGGWSTDYVMKENYYGIIENVEDEYTQKINDAFADVMLG